jgi:hypothetical protein
MGRSKSTYWISLIIYSLFSILNILFDSRGVFISYVAILFFFIVTYFTKINWLNSKLILLFGVISIGTVNSIVNLNLEFSLYQVLRSQGWFILSLFLISFSDRAIFFMNHRHYAQLVDVLNNLYILVGIFLLYFYFSGNIFFPYEIFAIESRRIYVIGTGAVLPLIIVFLNNRNFLSVFCGMFFLLVTGGKTGLLFLSAFFFYLFGNMRFNLIKTIFIGSVSLSIFLFYFFSVSSRSLEFLENGDLKRLQQIEESFEKFNHNYVTRLVGIGIGTKYGNGYDTYKYDPKAEVDPENLFINSQYDIENGFLFLLCRFGLLGTLLIFKLLFGMKGKFSFLFLFYCVIYFSSGSPVGPSFSIIVLAFSLLNNFKLHSSEFKSSYNLS